MRFANRFQIRDVISLMLLKKLKKSVAAWNRRARCVYSEPNQKISEIINNEPTPLFMRGMGERYHHFLLDEFQDTSTLQWHNILPFILTTQFCPQAGTIDQATVNKAFTAGVMPR